MKTKSKNKWCVLLAALVAAPALHADITNPAEPQADAVDDFFDQRTQMRADSDGSDPVPGVLYQKGADSKLMPWLGVATEPLPAALAAQLGLSKEGIVVSAVVPDSPAAKAGMENYDILLQMDGVALDSPETFREMVRGQKKGDKVKFHLMRKGEALDVEAELAEKSVSEVNEAAPQKAAPRKRGHSMFEDDVFKDGLGMGFGKFGGLGNMKEIEEHMRRIQEEMESRFNDLGDLGGGSGFMKMENSVMSYSDNEGSVKIERKDGKTHVEMRDPDGKVIFDGPANTPEERQKLPPKVVEKLEGFENSRIDFDFGGFKMDPPRIGQPSVEEGDAPKLQPKVRRKSELQKDKAEEETTEKSE